MSPRLGLTTADLARLRRLGDGVRSAGAGDRGPTIRLAVDATRTLHADGAGYPDLARALGVDTTVLRDWLDQQARTRTVTRSVPWLDSAAPPPRRDGHGSGVLVCTGHPQPNGNDFLSEVREIRDRVEPRFGLDEHNMIEIGELPSCIDRKAPYLLHIAAHSDNGAVFLTGGGAAVSILHAQLAAALLMARHRPSIVVRSFCRSVELIRTLRHAIPALVCWPDGVDDGQCQEMARLFYRAMAGGRTLADAMDVVTMTMQRRGALPRPVLVGRHSLRLR